MNDHATELFSTFVEARDRGEHPDPVDVIAAAPHDAREALGAMIVTYLAAHPRTDIPEAEVQELALRPASNPSLAWPVLLPQLRAESSTTRGAMVTALAAEIGYPEARSQVEEHVHHLETGQLNATGVSATVVQGLAKILHTPVALLEAGQRLAATPPPAASGVMFSRMADAAAAAAPAPLPSDRDIEVDRLFGADG